MNDIIQLYYNYCKILNGYNLEILNKKRLIFGKKYVYNSDQYYLIDFNLNDTVYISLPNHKLSIKIKKCSGKNLLN